MASKRRGMLIKNTNERAVTIEMTSRVITLHPGEEKFITAEEVRDSALRESLQLRTVSIVRPTTLDEEAAIRRSIEAGENP